MASVTLSPRPALYLFGSYRVDAVTERRTRGTGNFAIGWAPASQGTLQMSMRYDESFYPELDQVERSITPSVRWNIRPRLFLDVGYQNSFSKGESQRTDSGILRATLRCGL